MGSHEWKTSTARVMLGSQLQVSTKDLDLFLVVDVKHPPDVAGL